MVKKDWQVIPLAGQEFPSQPGYPPQPLDPPQNENFLSSVILQILRQIKKTFKKAKNVHKSSFVFKSEEAL